MPLSSLTGILKVTKMTQGLPQEVIVVEGRDDSQRLVQVFGPQIKTIETNGSALSRRVLERIKRAARDYGIIIFTDPDYQGDRIRRLVAEAVPQAKHAYLDRHQAQAKQAGKSLGVEHASPQAIRQALASVMTPSQVTDLQLIPTSSLMKLKLIGHPKASDHRDRLAKHFNLGHVNGKQLQKRLAQYQISLSAIKDFMEEYLDD